MKKNKLDKIRTKIFLEEFLTKENSFAFFKSLIYKGRDYLEPNLKADKPMPSLILLKDVPNYFQFEKTSQKKSIQIKSIATLQGYLIELDRFNTMGDYLKSKLGAKSRSNLRRYQSRLESCFNIRYVVYCGDIEKLEYSRLFMVLKELLIKRFDEKNERNYELPYLNSFEESLYPLLLEKKASMYVIYDGMKPISIRINIFKDNLAYYILSGYDIDYSKFHLGMLDMILNIKWLIENNFEMYDLLKGYESYKKKWYTTSYQNHNLIIYQRFSRISIVHFFKLLINQHLKYRFLYLVRYFHLNSIFKIFKRKLKQVVNSFDNNRVSIVASDQVLQGDLIPINIETDSFSFLRKQVYEFQFENKEASKDTKVFSFTNLPNYYKIKGEKHEQLISYGK